VRTGRRWPKLLFTLTLGAGSLNIAATAGAQVPIAGEATPTENGEAGARKHFDRSLELYRAGHYAEALEQLQQAAKLDPDGKDLFFNLALVHEKLGQLPEAIKALERFRELETDSAERERARLSIERLRGAEQAAQVAPAPSAPCAEPAPPPVPAPSEKSHQTVLIGAASVAVVSFLVGAVFGVKALSDDVSDARTSAALSVTELHERGRRAEREALVADVAFALGAASTATFAGVWLLSPGDPSKRAAGVTLRSYF
jgi:tetratricopeptide (TPR) repeat protein